MYLIAFPVTFRLTLTPLPNVIFNFKSFLCIVETFEQCKTVIFHTLRCVSEAYFNIYRLA